MRYTNDLPGEIKKVLADALVHINAERSPTIRQLLEQDLDVEVWVQTWGSTALGFGGMGGQAITGAFTTMVWAPNRSFALVYFAGRFAYKVKYPFSKFFYERYSSRQFPDVRDAHLLMTAKEKVG